MFRNPLEERGEKGLQRAQYVFLKKKFSPHTTCPQRAHTLCPHTGCTSCAPTHRVPFMGFSSLGPQNMGDWSGGVEERNESSAKSACPPDDQSSPCRQKDKMKALKKHKKIPMVSLILPIVLQTAPTGV